MLACITAAMALAGAVPASAGAAGYKKLTYSVPVTRPDEAGQPVSLDTDVYLPTGAAPAAGFPMIELFHGGGSDKSNPYDSGHAAYFADTGTWSSSTRPAATAARAARRRSSARRRSATSSTSTAWTLGVGGRDKPAHRDFHVNRRRIALAGYSQGGLHTNLGEVVGRRSLAESLRDLASGPSSPATPPTTHTRRWRPTTSSSSRSASGWSRPT